MANYQRLTVLLAAATLLTASCGAPDVGGGSEANEEFEEQNRVETERMERDALKPEDEGRVTAAEDDMDPSLANDPGYEVLDEPLIIADYPLRTFEEAIAAADYVFTATIVSVSDGQMWNTADGRYGSHDDWEGTGVDPFAWQQIEVIVTEIVLGDLKVEPDEKLQLVYDAAQPSFHAFDVSAVGASLLVGATDWTIEFLDGTTTKAFDIHPQATYISFSEGPALRLYDANNGADWQDLGGPSAKAPAQTSVGVAKSLEELVARALNLDIPAERQLGYYEIYGPRTTNPNASDIVP